MINNQRCRVFCAAVARKRGNKKQTFDKRSACSDASNIECVVSNVRSFTAVVNFPANVNKADVK